MPGLPGTHARRPPRHPRQAASADYRIKRCDTPYQIRAADNTASRSETHQLDPTYEIHIYQPLHLGRIWQKVYF